MRLAYPKAVLKQFDGSNSFPQVVGGQLPGGPQARPN